MATEYSTSPTPDGTSTQLSRIPAFNFPPITKYPLYAIASDVTADDLAELLASCLGHLDAMLHATYGEAGEAHRLANDELQESFMWACAMKARECRELFQQIEARRAA